MKAKIFIFLLAVLIMIPMNAAVERKSQAKFKGVVHKKIAVISSPINYAIDVNSDATSLQIMFRFPLSDADITVTDKNGNIVVYESQISTYDGKVLYIHASGAYPYIIEVTSPGVDIVGEIVLEESI